MDRQEELEQAEPQTRDKGFTLIELLIVIAILGILSAIVVLSVRGITDRGQEASCDADLKTLEIAQEAAFAKNLTLTYTPSTNAEEQLVAAGLLRSASSRYDITGDASITAVTGGGCEAVVSTPSTALTYVPGGAATYDGAQPADLAELSGLTNDNLGVWATGSFAPTGAGNYYWDGSAWQTGIA